MNIVCIENYQEYSFVSNNVTISCLCPT